MPSCCAVRSAASDPRSLYKHVQDLEASFDRSFETLALLEEEEANVDRSTADKAAKAGSHVDLDDIENHTVSE
jgi:hypothetical protein